jgi:IclR family acetate operon transcriptional repressor
MQQLRRPRGRPRNTSVTQSANTVQSLERALTLLRFVAAADGLTLTEIAQMAAMAPSTAHRLLVTLEQYGFVDLQPQTGEWSVGVEAFRTGTAFLRRTKVAVMGRGVMRDLMELCGETVNLGIADGDEVVFISQVETHETIRAFFRPGTRSPLHASGIGKALMAYMPRHRIEALVEKNGLTPFTPNTLTEVLGLMQALDEIRELGFAVDNEERTFGMRCIASAIFNEFGEAVAGISISGPSVRMTDDRLAQFVPHVRTAACNITVSIGGVMPGKEASISDITE